MYQAILVYLVVLIVFIYYARRLTIQVTSCLGKFNKKRD